MDVVDVVMRGEVEEVGLVVEVVDEVEVGVEMEMDMVAVEVQVK